MSAHKAPLLAPSGSASTGRRTGYNPCVNKVLVGIYTY